MIDARVEHTATLLTNGAMLVAGGVVYAGANNGHGANCELYR